MNGLWATASDNAIHIGLIPSKPTDRPAGRRPVAASARHGLTYRSPLDCNAAMRTTPPLPCDKAQRQVGERDVLCLHRIAAGGQLEAAFENEPMR